MNVSKLYVNSTETYIVHSSVNNAAAMDTILY